MFLELEREQVVLLMQLVESRLADLHAESRAAPEAKSATEIHHEEEQLECILHQLHECACDVMA